MKIYFSASISGGRKYLNIYKKIVDYLKSHGHHVFTEHIVLDNVLELEKKLTPTSIYERDMKLLNECDVVIAEVSNPSLGVGYEVCQALRLKKPTLCLFQIDIFVSRIIIGNTSPYITLGEYKDTAMLIHLIDKFLHR